MLNGTILVTILVLVRLLNNHQLFINH